MKRALLFLLAASCAPPPVVDAGVVDAPLAGASIFDVAPGLWSGPATRTLLGDFPVMNMDLRAAGDRELFSRVDLDAENSLRFGFLVEEHDGRSVVVYRNGGLFQGLTRDTRTTLVSAVDGAYRFCALDDGCEYVDATFTFAGDDVLLEALVRGEMHVTWEATREETRALPEGFAPTARPAGDFPPLPTLTVDVTFPALAAEADVWVLLSTTACGTTFSCTTSRSIAARASAGATSATLVLDQLHPGDYFATALLDRDRDLASTLRPDSGDGVSAIDDEVAVEPSGSTATLPIVFSLP